MGIISFLTVRFVEVIVVLFLILFMPSIPPNANFTHYKVTPSQELKGTLAINDRLNNVERIYENELKGAEAFAEYNGELYSSLYTGEIVKLSKGHIIPIVQFGKPCSGHAEESICGRPLGLHFDKQGTLYASDAYMGIWKVDVKTGTKTQLVSMDEEIEGKKPMLPNSLTLSENGDFYWTDSSTEFKLEDGLFSLLADGSGRLIHYNSKTKKNKVLMDGLHFANGVMLSSGEEFLIVAETARSRVYRFYLKGPKTGTHDIFADGLPGIPDNINSDGQDGFFLPLIGARDADHPLLNQIIGPHPWIRKLCARILGIIEVSFKAVHNIYPNMYTQMAIHAVGHFETMGGLFFQDRVTVLHYSKTGKLIDSLHGTDKTVGRISEAFIFGEHLYLGSPFNNYIGKVPLSKVGLEHLRKKREIPSQKPTEAPKPTPTPAPTKAPQKPTTPKPTAAPTTQPPKKTPPPTQAPVKQTPPPKPVKEAPVTQKQVPPAQKQAPPPQKQTPPPTQPPKKSPPPTQAPKHAPVKETPKPASVKETPKSAPVKETPPPKPTPAKETPSTQKQKPASQEQVTTENPTNKKVDDKLKAVPVKENAVPKPKA